MEFNYRQMDKGNQNYRPLPQVHLPIQKEKPEPPIPLSFAGRYLSPLFGLMGSFIRIPKRKPFQHRR